MTPTEQGPDAPARFAYADPPYLGQCGTYDHFHNDGGDMPWDGLCWDDQETHRLLLQTLAGEWPRGWAYSCNPSDLAWIDLDYGCERVGAWCKTFHQIRQTTVQYAWEVVVFSGGNDDPHRPMVRDWITGAVTRQTGQRGAKPDYFNDWILDLLAFREGDTLIDLFPGSGGMGRAVERRLRLPKLGIPENAEMVEL